MMFRIAAAAMIGAGLFSVPGVGQTIAEQMQKGIYAQETAGDLDAAIQIYRQVVNTSSDRKYAAMAQFRLAQSLLQKGEMQEAAREFGALVNYPEYNEVIMAMAGRSRAHGSAISRGTYTIASGQPSHYSNKASGVQLTVPVGWTLADMESSDNGDMAVLADSNRQSVIAIWMIAEQHPASDLAELLRHDVENKHQMRPEGWRVRPESIQAGGGGDHQFLSAVADFTENGSKMIEYLVWARSTKSHLVFFGTIPASQASSGYREKLMQLVSTAVIP
jgi:hypothetical protein